VAYNNFRNGSNFNILSRFVKPKAYMPPLKEL